MKVEQDVMAYGVEQDNAGCYFIEDEIILRKPEKIETTKNSATAASVGSLRRTMRTASASERHSLPIRQM